MSSRSPSGNPSHGGDIDPNEIRMRLAHNASSQSSSPPPDHGGDADPNEIRRRVGQGHSASPLLRNQAGISTTTRAMGSQESTTQFSTPSPSSYGNIIHSSAGPSQSARPDQPSSQALSGYFQGAPIHQPFGGHQVQHTQTAATASPPPGVYGSPLPQTSSPSFPAQTHGSPNQQTNGYSGQPSQNSQGLPPQVRTQACLCEKEADKSRRATSLSQRTTTSRGATTTHHSRLRVLTNQGR